MTENINEVFNRISENVNSIYDLKIRAQMYEDLETLKRQLFPTVEMTQQEFEVFSKAKVDEDSAEWLDNIEWGHVDYKYPDFFMAWLHPETIKVVD